jgi:hypothetical protein
MKKIIVTFIVVLLSLSNVYADKCFLYIEKPGNLNPQITSTLAISLISQYIEKLESVPLSGIGKHDCVYKVGVTESQSGLFVTISGRGLSAYGDSKKGGVDGLQVALLRSIYRVKLDQKENICEAYGTVLKEDCRLTTALAPDSHSSFAKQTPVDKSFKTTKFGWLQNTKKVLIGDGNWRVVLEELERDRDSLIMTFSMRNMTSHTSIFFSWSNTAIVDEEGNEYNIIKVEGFPRNGSNFKAKVKRKGLKLVTKYPKGSKVSTLHFEFGYIKKSGRGITHIKVQEDLEFP